MIKFFFKITLLILLVVWTLFRIFSDINKPPARWDEVTNIRALRETADKKSFPVLYYANKPFFQKPPLWYLINLPFVSHEKSEVIKFRIVSIISAFLIIALSVFFVWKHTGFIGGIITWVMLLLSNQFYTRNPAGIFSSHTLTSADSDSLQLLFILITFWLLHSKNKSAYLLAGISTGLAVLTKGPLGFVPIIVLTMLGKKVKTAAIVAFVFILPWYIMMFISFGQEFLQSHIGYHLIQRTTSAIEGHQNPPWYYLQILTNPRIYPVLPLLLISIICLKFIRTIPFSIIYCGLTALIFFMIPTLVGTRLAWYILPVYPFLAMFTGMVFGKLKNN